MSGTGRIFLRRGLLLEGADFVDADLTVAGGTVHGEFALAGPLGRLMVSGGELSEVIIELSGGSTARISAGLGEGALLVAAHPDDGQAARVLGSDFEVDGSPVAPGPILDVSQGRLTGVLASGEPFDNQTPGAITLPSPDAWLSGTVALAVVSLRARRRRSATSRVV